MQAVSPSFEVDLEETLPWTVLFGLYTWWYAGEVNKRDLFGLC